MERESVVMPGGFSGNEEEFRTLLTRQRKDIEKLQRAKAPAARLNKASKDTATARTTAHRLDQMSDLLSAMRSELHDAARAETKRTQQAMSEAFDSCERDMDAVLERFGTLESELAAKGIYTFYTAQQVEVFSQSRREWVPAEVVVVEDEGTLQVEYEAPTHPGERALQARKQVDPADAAAIRPSPRITSDVARAREDARIADEDLRRAKELADKQKQAAKMVEQLRREKSTAAAKLAQEELGLSDKALQEGTVLVVGDYGRGVYQSIKVSTWGRKGPKEHVVQVRVCRHSP
jgi:hypothetical protein